MLKYILPLIPEHNVYTEAFCGGAAVLFAKPPAEAEVINDINMELVNFYWCCQMYYPDLKAEIDRTLHCRDQHAHAAHINAYPQFFTPVQRAWAVWMLSKSSFASKLDGAFGYDFRGGMSKKLRNAKDNFTEELCRRLEHVTIENRDALTVIKTYDRPDTFHFIDPPYVNSNCGPYSGTFCDRDLQGLLQLLESVSGKFMLTMFPHAAIEQEAARKGWLIHRVERPITASKTSRRRQEEWMGCNYQLSENQMGGGTYLP